MGRLVGNRGRACQGICWLQRVFIDVLGRRRCLQRLRLLIDIHGGGDDADNCETVDVDGREQETVLGFGQLKAPLQKEIMVNKLDKYIFNQNI